jgi:hypothetical protein
VGIEVVDHMDLRLLPCNLSSLFGQGCPFPLVEKCHSLAFGPHFMDDAKLGSQLVRVRGTVRA